MPDSTSVANVRSTIGDRSASSLSARTRRRIAILSLLFNWPSTGGGIVHTTEAAAFLERAGYCVRHFYAVFGPWRLGEVSEPTISPAEPVLFQPAEWNAPTIARRFRTAVDRFAPDAVIVTDSWNMKPLLVEAMLRYRTFLRLAALECLCPLNNVWLLMDEAGNPKQCPRHQLATPDACRTGVSAFSGLSGGLHQAERELAGFAAEDYPRRLRRSFEQAEAVLVVNPLIAEMVSPFARRVAVIPSGFDPARFPWPPQRKETADGDVKQIFLAGLIHEYMKGFHSLLGGRWPSQGRNGNDRPLRFFTRREIQKRLFRAGFDVRQTWPLAGPGHREWVQAGRPAECRAGFHVNCSLPNEAEEFFAAGFLLTALPRQRRPSGLASVVVVTHNTLDYTRRCLESIRQNTLAPFELVRSMRDVRLIENPENRGFPAACNQGLRASKGDVALLLNNDTVATTGWLRRMLAACETQPDVGLVGPVSNSVSGPQQVPIDYDSLQDLDGFAWDWGRKHADELVEESRLVGFCLAIRREVIEEIGLLDEQCANGATIPLALTSFNNGEAAWEGAGTFCDDDDIRITLECGPPASCVWSMRYCFPGPDPCGTPCNNANTSGPNDDVSCDPFSLTFFD
ncbi:MAG: glycosyltransferase [Planctomycetes bacterium]|nr:glycosyltransferase [Planctomycetota bacterium]